MNLLHTGIDAVLDDVATLQRALEDRPWAAHDN
jgi:hypothetical protein